MHTWDWLALLYILRWRSIFWADVYIIKILWLLTILEASYRVCRFLKNRIDEASRNAGRSV